MVTIANARANRVKASPKAINKMMPARIQSASAIGRCVPCCPLLVVSTSTSLGVVFTCLNH